LWRAVMAVCEGRAESVRGLATRYMSAIHRVSNGVGVGVLCAGPGVGRCLRRWKGCKGGGCMGSFCIWSGDMVCLPIGGV
jgi:hypothetical protein